MQEKIYAKGRVGKDGEDLAAGYLKAKRFHIVERNFRSKCGEIDIIARRGRSLYFFEVKTRGRGSLIEPLEAITNAQMARIRRTATLYLLKNPKMERMSCSFGVIGVDCKRIPPRIECILDAFE